MRTEKVFIDSNMIMNAANFLSADVFEWIDELYPEKFIHLAVYEELILAEYKQKVDQLIKEERWVLFDPEKFFDQQEMLVYDLQYENVRAAFERLNDERIQQGIAPKTVSNIGEIATITACLMIDAGIICSNDFDIRQVVARERYTIVYDNQDILIIQDSAEDFCVYCYQSAIATRKLVRNFYKSVVLSGKDAKRKIEHLTRRMDEETK